MALFPDGLVSEADAKAIFGLRSKNVDELKVKAGNPEALETLVEGHIKDGWTRPAPAAKKKTPGGKQRKSRTVTLVKEKPSDRQLEDDVWCLLYNLGFKEMNRDRNLTFKVGDDSPARQLDVFAKDDETIFIVECTQSIDQGGKSLKSLIDKINGIKEAVIKAVHAKYGREPKLKVKWAIATRNVDWRAADRVRAAEAKIGIITETELAYYTRLCSFLKGAARYQFLASYLKGEGVDGLRIEVPATRGRMGDTYFYNFLISPEDLLKISFISHRAGSSPDDFETYQRMVKPSRLQKIGAYIDDGGQFPTNIVINFKTKLDFQKIDSKGGGVFGTLKLPGLYGSAWVIDGQHRLYGFAFAERGKGHVVPVLAYEDLPAKDEMRLFVDINSKQVKVQPSLLKELYSNLNHGSDDPAKRHEAQYPRVSIKLNQMTKSPIRDRLIFSEKEKTHFRCLTLTSLADGIEENKFVGNYTQTGKNPAVFMAGPLTHSSGNSEQTAEKAADTLSAYFDLFAQGVPGNWSLGDDKGGFLCTNNGLRALMRLLAQILSFVDHRDAVKSFDLDPDDIIAKVKPFTEPLIAFFAAASADEILSFRQRQALGGVNQNAIGMRAIIAEVKPEFSNAEVTEYLESRDKEGTKVARALLNDINEILFKDVIGKLRAVYGNDRWWWDGIPSDVREACVVMRNRDNGLKDEYQYLYLANYQAIVSKSGNWDHFSDRYDFSGKGKPIERVSWIGHLNKIRQTTHHPEKGEISKAEVAYVKEIHSKVRERILNAPIVLEPA